MQVCTDALKVGAVMSGVCLIESLTAIRPKLPDPFNTDYCICPCFSSHAVNGTRDSLGWDGFGDGIMI